MVQSYGNDGNMFDPNIKFESFFAINRYLKIHVNEWLGGTFNQTLKSSWHSKLNVLCYGQTMT